MTQTPTKDAETWEEAQALLRRQATRLGIRDFMEGKPINHDGEPTAHQLYYENGRIVAAEARARGIRWTSPNRIPPSVKKMVCEWLHARARAQDPSP